MKKKDILVLLIALVMIGGSGFAIYKMLAPASSSTETGTNTNTDANGNTDTITGNIDDTAIEEVVTRTDYGEAALDGIGRTNPFGPLE